MRANLLVAAAALACFAFATASVPPARADSQAMGGVYTYRQADGSSGSWTIDTACTPNCVAYVTTSHGHGFAAPIVHGRASVTRTVPDGVTCPLYPFAESLWGGGSYPVTVNQSWDPHTLAGEVDFVDTPAPCGIAAPHQTFTLTKVS